MPIQPIEDDPLLSPENAHRLRILEARAEALRTSFDRNRRRQEELRERHSRHLEILEAKLASLGLSFEQDEGDDQ